MPNPKKRPKKAWPEYYLFSWCWLVILGLVVPMDSQAQDRKSILAGLARFIQTHPTYDPQYFETTVAGHDSKIVYHYQVSKGMDSLYVSTEQDDRNTDSTGIYPDTTIAVLRFSWLDLMKSSSTPSAYTSVTFTLSLFGNRHISRQLIRPFNDAVRYTDHPDLAIRFKLKNDEQAQFTGYLKQLADANFRVRNPTGGQ